MPTRPHPRARTLSIAVAAGVAATVAALAAFPYVLEGFLREGGSVGGMRWSAPGAEFSWPFHFKADSVVVKGEGRRIAVDAPEIRLDLDPFGESLVAVSARKAVVVLPPGDSPAPADSAAPDSSAAARQPSVPSFPSGLVLPVSASVAVDSVEADVGGERVSASGISLRAESGSGLDFRAEKLSSPRVGRDLSVEARADWTGDSARARAVVASGGDTVVLEAAAPKEDLRLYDARTEIRVDDPTLFGPVPKNAPIMPGKIRANARATALVGSPLPRHETDLAFETDALGPIPPMKWTAKVSGLGTSGSARIEGRGPRGESISLDAEGSPDGAKGKAAFHGMHIELGGFVLPIDFTVPQAEWDGKEGVRAVAVTKEGTRVNAVIDRLTGKGGPHGKFVMHMSPDEPWADTWTDKNTHYEHGITYGEFGHGMVNMDIHLADVSAYGFVGDSLCTRLKIDTTGLVFWDAKLVHDRLDYPVHGEVRPFGDGPITIMFMVDLPGGGVARAEGPVLDSLTLMLTSVPIREVPLGLAEETIHSLPGVVTGVVGRNMETGISRGQVNVVASIDSGAGTVSSRMRLTHRDDTIRIDSLALRQDVNLLRGNALFVIGSESGAPGGLQEASISTERLDVRALSAPWTGDVALNGFLSGELHFNARLEIDGALTLDSLSVSRDGAQIVSSPRLALDAEKDSVRLEGFVRPGVVRGFDGKLGLTAGDLFTDRPRFALSYDAEGQGSLRAGGTIADRRNLSGEFRLEGDWTDPGETVRLEGSEVNGSLSLDLRRGLPTLRANASQSAGDAVFAGMRAPLRAEAAVADQKLSGEAELRNDRGERISATLAMDLGENRIDAFDFGTDRFVYALSDREEITLVDVRGKLDGGRLTLRSPGVRYENRLGRKGRLLAATRNLSLAYSFAEEGRHAKIGGAMTVDTLLFAKYDLPELSIWSLMRMLPEAFAPRKKSAETKTARVPSAAIPAVDLDVRLVEANSDALAARTNVFELPLAVDLQIRGTTQHPILDGDVRAPDNGWLNLQSDRYVVSRASVEWQSRPPSKGRVDIGASRELPLCNATREEEEERCDVALRVGGTIDKIGLTAEAEGCSRNVASRDALQSLQFGCVLDADENNLMGTSLQIAESTLESAGRDATSSLNKVMGNNLLGAPKISLAKGAQNALARGESTSLGEADSASFSGELPFNVVDSTLILSIGYTKATGTEATYNDITRAGAQWFFHTSRDTTDYWQGRYSLDAGAQLRTFATESEAESETQNQLEFSVGVSHEVGFWGDCLFGRCRERQRERAEEREEASGE